MSGWRAKVDSALGRDTRDTRDKRSPDGASVGPIVPFVPIVPAPLDALRSWCDALNALDACQPRTGFTMNRWQKLLDASAWFVETFGRQAAMDGWTTSDLFGVLRQIEGAGGLMDQLGDHRGLVLSADEARWRYLGQVPQLYRRGQWPNLDPFWSADL